MNTVNASYLSIFLVVASILFFTTCEADKSINKRRIYFEKSGEVVINPGQGWVLYGLPSNHNASTIALGTAGYHRYNWADINTSEDVYDWEPIDNAINLWAQRGKQFAFGIMSVNTSRTDEYCTPKWVFDKGAAYTMGNGENSNDRRYFLPVWDDPVYVAACKKFAEALAQRYDGNPNIAFIDIRNYGNWGEMHMYPFNQHTQDLTAEQVQNLLIKPYIDNFINTQLIICYGSWPLNNSINNWVVDNGIGLRLDGIMGNQQLTGHSGNGDVISMATGKEPVVWEFLMASFMFLENYPLWNDDRFMNNIRANKPSYIGLGGWTDAQYMLNQKPELVREVTNLMGYNLSMTAARYANTVSSNEVTIEISIENSGVTNMLTDCVIKLALLDDSDNVVSSFSTDWNAKSIIGGVTAEFKADVVFADAPAGNYKLAIGLYRNENDPKPTYNLDNKGRVGDGYYILGGLYIMKKN